MKQADRIKSLKERIESLRMSLQNLDEEEHVIFNMSLENLALPGFRNEMQNRIDEIARLRGSMAFELHNLEKELDPS